MTDYSTDGEFVELGKSGLDWKDVLAMLTTNPSPHGRLQREGNGHAGKARRPYDPRLPIPPMDLTNFARVQMVIRSGTGDLAEAVCSPALNLASKSLCAC